MQRILELIAVWPQYLLPHHTLSQLMFWFMRIRWTGVKNLQIRWFQWQYKVDLADAEISDINQFACFNDFFTRALRSDARPVVATEKALACPVDGAISQLGLIEKERIFQAKGHDFSLITLLGGSAHRAKPFQQGKFATIYLSPRDYHRIHCPLDAKLVETVYIPGRLFSVNPTTARTVPSLFARNERFVCVFETEIGRFALVMVGAIFVSSMATVWSGIVPPKSHIVVQKFGDNAPQLQRGDELGRFNMGSTVILLGTENINWEAALSAGDKVQMGQSIAEWR